MKEAHHHGHDVADDHVQEPVGDHAHNPHHDHEATSHHETGEQHSDHGHHGPHKVYSETDMSIEAVLSRRAQRTMAPKIWDSRQHHPNFRYLTF